MGSGAIIHHQGSINHENDPSPSIILHYLLENNNKKKTFGHLISISKSSLKTGGNVWYGGRQGATERRARDDRETGGEVSGRRHPWGQAAVAHNHSGAQPLGRTTVAHRVQPSGTRAKSNGSPRRFTIVLVTHITAE